MNREECKIFSKAGQLLGELLRLYSSGKISLDVYLHGQMCEVKSQIQSHLQTQADKLALREEEIHSAITQIETSIPLPSGEQLNLFEKAANESPRSQPPKNNFKPENPPAVHPPSNNPVDLAMRKVEKEDVVLAIVSEAAKGSGRTKIVNFAVGRCGYPKADVEGIFDELLRNGTLVKEGKSFVSTVNEHPPEPEKKAEEEPESSNSGPLDGLESIVV